MATATAIDTRQTNLRRAAIVGALGIVYGDIGTSPLYAFKEALRSAGSVDALQPIIFGCVSLIFWALIIVVSIKYVLVVMRATNDGEGGIMALTALSTTALVTERWRELAILCGLAGAALFYGDCVITPAISVLSAVEGLNVATTIFEPYIVFIAASILAGLLILQRRGTARIGKLFGPIMLVWFIVIGGVGAIHLFEHPEILAALNPVHGLNLIIYHGWIGFHVLGSVFLVVTGAEALYADEGHFRGDIIRLDWFSIVLPALLLNYLGQGALVLSNPAAASNPFYLMFPGWALYPAVLLATAATIIASQAVISGAFTITQQAMQLGFLPRMETRFTSQTEAGQIYVPRVNWLLALAVISLVLSFKSSGALAGAYGVAVSTTMLATTLLVAVVARNIWRWSGILTFAVISAFFVVDAAFFSANLAKIMEGGYVPILAGIGVFIVMSTWHRGRTMLLERIAQDSPTLDAFWEQMHCEKMPRVPGVAIYLTSRGDRVPAAMKLNVKHNKCLHETVIILTVVAERIPRVHTSRRLTTEVLKHGFRRITLRYGFAETPDVPRSLRRAIERKIDLGFEMGSQVSYFVGRTIPVPSEKPDLSAWREPLYLFLTKNSTSASDFFQMPPEAVVELGTHIEI